MRMLYVKPLIACNAGCYMCSYRHSNDQYRMSVKEFKVLAEAAKKGNYNWIRITGGEPLLHNNIIDFIKIAKSLELKISIITNGILLDSKLPELIEASIDQLIISIDGFGELNDTMRDSKNLFKKDIDSLKYAKEHDILTRVNTVVGKINYKSLPLLRDKLDDIGIDAWEVTPVKLNNQLNYSEEEKNMLRKIIFDLFSDKRTLKPLGEPWLVTEKEAKAFFEYNIMPHNDDICHIVEDVRYFDGVTNRLYTCNMVSHRKIQNYIELNLKKQIDLNAEEILAIVNKYKYEECKNCVGCSTSAVNYRYNKELNY